MLSPRARVAAFVLIAAWLGFALVIGSLDRAPQWGGPEASDLQRAMHYHYGLRGHLDWTFAEQVARDGFKPPLWFGGVPLLFAASSTLRLVHFVLVDAICLAGAAWFAMRGAHAVGAGRAAGWALPLTLLLPGVSGRLLLPGVEPLHALLLGALADRLIALPTSARPLRGGLVVGALVGLGALAKWNFLAIAAVPCAVAVAIAPRRLGPALAFGAAVAAALFAAWLLPFGDLRAILDQARAGEPSFAVGDPRRLGFYPRELLAGLGYSGTALLIAALALPRRAPSAILLATAFAPLVAHLPVPHTEARYLLAGLPAFAALAAVGLSRAPRFAAPLAVAALLTESFAVPALTVPPPRFSASPLRPLADRSDYGLDALVRHPSLGARETAVVTYVLGGPAPLSLAASLQWELYARNARPAISRSTWPRVDERACLYDLERSTHLVLDRDPDPAEARRLREYGFARVAVVTPRIDGVPTLQLFALDPARRPKQKGFDPS